MESSRRCRAGWVVALGLGLSAAVAVAVAEPAPHGGLTVPDLIGLTRIGSRLIGGMGGDDHVMSPNGSGVAVVAQRGDLRHNSRVFKLLIFSLSAASNPPKPEVAAVFVTTSNRPGISQVAWLSEHLISFVGEEPGRSPQIFSVDLQTHRRIRLTHARQPVLAYKPANQGRTFIFATAAAPADTSRFGFPRNHGFAVPHTMSASDVIARHWGQLSGAGEPRGRIHSLQHGRDASFETPDRDRYGDCVLDSPDDFLPSPTGALVLLLCVPYIAPPTFGRYDEPRLRETLATGSQYPWWVVVDMKTGMATPLTGAPAAQLQRPPVWTSDTTVLLIDDFLSLEGVDPDERERRAGTRLTAEIDVRTHAARPTAEPAITPPPSPLQTREALREPWKLVRRTTGLQAIYDPNPALAGRRLANVTTLTWSTKSGMRLAGGLYWPLNFVAGKRYPLLIQTHGFDADRFSPEGFSTSGYAAQPMAAAGIAVVQAYKCVAACPEEHNDLREGLEAQQAFEALIDHLDAVGLIDTAKVALQGFSRSCYHELYFLTHSDYPIAAATCTEGFDASYLQYLFAVPGDPAWAGDFEAHNGGSPFGMTLSAWLAHAPGFNLERVRTPMQLIALNSGLSVLMEWEIFSGLLVQGKPAELLCIPEAVHNVVRPWDRMASQQNAVDWYRFWLQSYERTEPFPDAEESAASLAEQYARWRKLRSSLSGHSPRA